MVRYLPGPMVIREPVGSFRLPLTNGLICSPYFIRLEMPSPAGDAASPLMDALASCAGVNKDFFQASYGVSISRLSGAVPVPPALTAPMVTPNVPEEDVMPLIRPDVVFTARPEGRPEAL